MALVASTLSSVLKVRGSWSAESFIVAGLCNYQRTGSPYVPVTYRVHTCTHERECSPSSGARGDFQTLVDGMARCSRDKLENVCQEQFMLMATGLWPHHFHRAVGAGPAGPAAAGPIFGQPTRANLNAV